MPVFKILPESTISLHNLEPFKRIFPDDWSQDSRDKDVLVIFIISMDVLLTVNLLIQLKSYPEVVLDKWKQLSIYFFRENTIRLLQHFHQRTITFKEKIEKMSLPYLPLSWPIDLSELFAKNTTTKCLYNFFFWTGSLKRFSHLQSLNVSL